MSEPFRDRRREMYGEWVQESEEERALRELGKDYHEMCEAYDRRVCSGEHPETGEAIPVNPSEYALVNKHAWETRTEIVRIGRVRYGFTEEQVRQAIKNYVKGKA